MAACNTGCPSSELAQRSCRAIYCSPCCNMKEAVSPFSPAALHLLSVYFLAVRVWDALGAIVWHLASTHHRGRPAAYAAVGVVHSIPKLFDALSPSLFVSPIHNTFADKETLIYSQQGQERLATHFCAHKQAFCSSGRFGDRIFETTTARSPSHCRVHHHIAALPSTTQRTFPLSCCLQRRRRSRSGMQRCVASRGQHQGRVFVVKHKRR